MHDGGNRTRVQRWAPSFVQALRLALRPALAYLVFWVGGYLALLGSIVWYEGTDKIVAIGLGCAAGLAGLVAGMLVAVLRARTLPVLVVGGASVTVATILIMMAHPPFSDEIALMIVLFCFAFPCGMLSLQHRWELFASFSPPSDGSAACS